MLYFANPAGKQGTIGYARVQAAMTSGKIAFIDTPRQGNARPEGVRWCADNGCFSEQFDERQWFAFLERNAYAAADCAFAVAPDVVGDHAATVERSAPWLAKIRALGYKVAFVAQDGWNADTVPWDDIDVVFIGGSDAFKVGVAPAGRVRPLRLDGTPLADDVPSIQVVKDAKAHGKAVHMGRVNTRCRYRFAAMIGCDSADGTCLTKGNTAIAENLPAVLGWVEEYHQALRELAAAKRDDAEKVAKAAANAGWMPVDALHADGYERGREVLTVIYAAGRAVHAVYSVYGADPYDPIHREAEAGAAVLDFTLALLADTPADPR